MIADYAAFLRTKRLTVAPAGRWIAPEAVNPLLFPWQRELVLWALKKGRCALLAGTGLGKTFMQIEFARLTGERTLILAPLAVAQQTVREGEKLGVTITYARSQAQAAPNGLTITNYQMLHAFDPAAFGTVVLDESSILKDETAATRAALIAAFAATPYRLAATATPCPNDIAEIANHAEFLGVMTRAEMLASFFINDDDGWRLKRHAVQPFYRWLASWAMSLENPADLGFPADGYDLPPLAIEPVFVDTDYVPPGRLFADRLQGVTETATVRRETLAARVSAAAALVAAEPEEAWIVWTGLNEESTQMTRALPGSVEVRGSDTLTAKIEKLTAFSEGRARILVTKAGIAGHGMNWQHCARMVFVGLGYSFEAYFQAIRRCWRFGQERPVRVTIVLTELERGIFEVVLEKERQASELTRQLIAHVADYERAELAPTVADVDYLPGQPMRLPWWLDDGARPTPLPALEAVQIGAADDPGAADA